MTFIASATSVLHTGATPVLADIDPATGCIDPAKVEAAITPRTKALLPVHLYGTMADMRSLRDIADRRKLFLIEDAAHCVEGERDGVRPGQLSDVACYSFYATKNLTCGEGGALATNDQALAEKVRLLRLHGMNKEAADRYHGLYRHWDMVALGWKYNLDDIHAALLVSQLDRLDALWARRRDLDAMYRDALSDIDWIKLPEVPGKGAFHLFTIQVPAEMRDRLLSFLGEQGIGVAVNYRAIHTLRWFREHMGLTPEDFPAALEWGQRTVSLPFWVGMGEEEVGRVAECLARAGRELR